MRQLDIAEGYYSNDVVYDEDGDEVLDEGPVQGGGYYEIEDEILNRLSIETALARLSPDDREMVHLWYSYRNPRDYDGMWPPSLKDIAEYLGRRNVHSEQESGVGNSALERPISHVVAERSRAPLEVRAVRYRHAKVMAQLRLMRGDDTLQEAA